MKIISQSTPVYAALSDPDAPAAIVLPTVDELRVSLDMTTCPFCGVGKFANETCCFECWARLSKHTTNGLNHRLGRGYEQAFGSAMRQLGIERCRYISIGERRGDEEGNGFDMVDTGPPARQATAGH